MLPHHIALRWSARNPIDLKILGLAPRLYSAARFAGGAQSFWSRRDQMFIAINHPKYGLRREPHVAAPHCAPLERA